MFLHEVAQASETAHQVRLGGGELDPEHVGDLGDGKVMAVAEHQGGALLRRQIVEALQAGGETLADFIISILESTPSKL